MAAKSRIESAVRLAEVDARDLRSAQPDGQQRTVHVAVGDPQAPLATFFAILDRHGLLGADGRLEARVALTSIGDHFDYGPPAWRQRATDEGLQLLSWLAAHPADQVTLILGNHDLARVDQLAGLDGAAYERARHEADRAYHLGDRDEPLQAAFLGRWPQFPDSETIARDFSTFSVRQRGLVTLLLRERRFRLAHAHGERLLLVHAGVTQGDLGAIGAPLTDAKAVAHALNRFLDDAVARWPGDSALSLMPLHRPGTASLGEARGILSHRPAHPDRALPEQLEGPPRRRFDPRELLPGVTQVIGHIRDGKCRQLLGAWADSPEGADGPIRQLTLSGSEVRYARGSSRDAAMLFIDGGMNHAAVGAYEVLDLDLAQPRTKLAISGT